MAQAITLQAGQIRYLLRVTAATSTHPERDCLVLWLRSVYDSRGDSETVLAQANG
jgi:hypothetical protein